MIYVMKNGKTIHPLIRFGLFSIWSVQIGTFILFNSSYPFRCTMDARYIVPAIIIGIIYFGIGIDLISKRPRQTVGTQK